MNKEKLYIFDTTLRDGAQTEGVDFSVEDKNKIAKVLSEIDRPMKGLAWCKSVEFFKTFKSK